MEHIATKNIIIQKRINLISGVVFLVPVATLLYQHTGLNTFEIILISNVATFGVWLLELPTSVLADTIGRKVSLILSVSANLLGALCIFLFPNYTGFIIAAIFSSLYWSFWRGTGQAFLEENLSILHRKKDFGKVIGEFMFWENTVGIITPLLAGLVLKYCGSAGYTILAGLDVIFALVLLLITLLLQEVSPMTRGTFSEMWRKNIATAKTAFVNVFGNKNMRILLLYRTFGNHVAYLSLIILPLLVEYGMADWMGGLIMTFSALLLSVNYKFTPVLTQKIGYIKTWLLAVFLQGIFLIICGLLLGMQWRIIAIIFIVYNALDAWWQPSWNHVLVHNSSGGSLTTTRSLIFSVFALWMTLGKQFLGLLDEKIALIVIGVFVCIVTVLASQKMMQLDE